MSGSVDASILGQAPEAYAKWILNKNNWGGGIELRLLSDFFECQIVAMNRATNRFDVFGEDRDYVSRAFVMYTGTHYDAVAVTPRGGTTGVKPTTKFHPTRGDVAKHARLLLLREHKAYLEEMKV